MHGFCMFRKRCRKQIRDTIIVDIQSRTPATALEGPEADLQIRINPDDSNSGKPSKQGLDDLKNRIATDQERSRKSP